MTTTGMAWRFETFFRSAGGSTRLSLHVADIPDCLPARRRGFGALDDKVLPEETSDALRASVVERNVGVKWTCWKSQQGEVSGPSKIASGIPDSLFSCGGVKK
jgi:hypothetical protein